MNGVETTEGGHASPSPPEDGHPAAADTLDNGIVSPEESTTGLVAAVKATNDTPDIWKTRLWYATREIGAFSVQVMLTTE